MAAKHARVEVYKSPATVGKRTTCGPFTVEYVPGAEWRWRFVATNGKIVADSAEGYRDRGDAIHGVELALGLATLGTGEKPHDGDVVFRDNELGVAFRVLS